MVVGNIMRGIVWEQTWTLLKGATMTNGNSILWAMYEHSVITFKYPKSFQAVGAVVMAKNVQRFPHNACARENVAYSLVGVLWQVNPASVSVHVRLDYDTFKCLQRDKQLIRGTIFIYRWNRKRSSLEHSQSTRSACWPRSASAGQYFQQCSQCFVLAVPRAGEIDLVMIDDVPCGWQKITAFPLWPTANYDPRQRVGAKCRTEYELRSKLMRIVYGEDEFLCECHFKS